MTLLVAAIAETQVWMVSDTLITGGTIEVREREYQLKIIASADGRALIGFAGDAHNGARIIEEAARLPGGGSAVAFLLDNHRANPSIDFAYGYVDGKGPHLIRVSQGEAKEVLTLHIGVVDAFEHFQRIRHDAEAHPIPEALIIFFSGSRAADPVPAGLNVAITSMLRLFAERPERDVGGWPLGYHLTSTGAFICGYGYSASDPILTKIGPGSIVPHGTAEAGGFGLSVTELGHGAGVVVYWLQRSGGIVFRRTAAGYERVDFQGTPLVFKEQASAACGQRVEIMFGDQPASQLESLTVMRDENGRPSMVLARHGDAISFSVLNVGTAFRSRVRLNLKDSDRDRVGGALTTDHATVSLSKDKSTAAIRLITNGQPSTQIELLASELDAILAVLGEARAVMRDTVPHDPPEVRSARELMVPDPIWRADPPIHQALNGIILRLRHPGFGWLTFLLPYQEAHNLGNWLLKAVRPTPSSSPAPDTRSDVNGTPP
jgi:hypothetical protein